MSESITTVKMSKGNYCIERIDGFSIEVTRESKRVWRTSFDNSTRKTLGVFENEMEAGLINPIAEKPKAKRVKTSKSKKSIFYKGHRSEKAAELHKAYDTMEREDALARATELEIPLATARAWFSDWKRADKKKEENNN